MTNVHLSLRKLADYRWSTFRPDLTAGLGIAAVAIPSAVAYPAIAGLPAEVGLYASILPLIGYAIFGPSKQLIVGPDAATMTVLAAVLATLPLASPGERVTAAAAMAVIVGVLCVLGRLLGLGVVASFLSRPILVGFIAGISLSILIGQLGRMTGVRLESEGLVPPLVELAGKFGLVHWPSIGLAAGCIALMFALQWLRSPVPGALVVVIVAILASAAFDLAGHGIRVVGPLPQALPWPSLPFSGRLPLKEAILGAGAVWLVSLGSGIVAARSFGERGGFPVDANRELLGIGAANLIGGLFSAFPVTVSDSRTAMNLAIGGRTQMAGLVAAATLTLLMVAFGNGLSLLPIPALGAVLTVAAIGLIDVAALREIWRISRMEFLFAMIGAWGAVSLGVLDGVIIAVAATLLYILLKEMRPRDALLGRREGRAGFYKLHRSPQARAVPGLTICLLEGSLLFFNVDYVRKRLDEVVAEEGAALRWFVLDASAIVQIDSTGAQMLLDFNKALAAGGARLGLAEMHLEARDILGRAGVVAAIGSDMVFEDLEDALAAYRRTGS